MKDMSSLLFDVDFLKTDTSRKYDAYKESLKLYESAKEKLVDALKVNGPIMYCGMVYIYQAPNGYYSIKPKYATDIHFEEEEVPSEKRNDDSAQVAG